MTSERYGNWTITYDPKPIPTRKFDFNFWHDDYDGAPDSFDNRAGTAASIEEAKLEIDMIEDMERDLTPAEEERVQQSLNKFWLMDANQRLLRGLQEIADAYLGDQPAGHPGTQYDWAVDHIRRLRGIAQYTLASVDRSGEAGETPESGSSEGESAVRDSGDAQTPNSTGAGQ